MKINFNIKEVSEIAEKILEKASSAEKKGASVVALSGDLGVGKTTITKEIAKILGVNENITSPTFVVMKTYDINSVSSFKKLIHIDAYRLESENELFILGWDKIIKDENNIIILEWPERVEKCLNKEAFLIKLKHIDEDNREIDFCFE